MDSGLKPNQSDQVFASFKLILLQIMGGYDFFKWHLTNYGLPNHILLKLLYYLSRKQLQRFYEFIFKSLMILVDLNEEINETEAFCDII